MEDRLAFIDMKQSDSSEVALMGLGSVLSKALYSASRIDEVELMLDLIGEYSTATSYYGTATGRIAESMAVDLNEACLLKKRELESGVDTEWEVYLEQFERSLKGANDSLRQ